MCCGATLAAGRYQGKQVSDRARDRTIDGIILRIRPRHSLDMSIDHAAVQKIAWLARLKLAESDVPEYARQLSGILEFVDQMNRVDTSGIEALAHPLELALRLREDAITETDRR